MDDHAAAERHADRQQAYGRIAGSPPFAELRQRYLRFVAPLTGAGAENATPH